MSNATLPAGFEDLLPWADWGADDMEDRGRRRVGSTMEEIEAFYEAILSRLDAVLDHLSATPIDELDPPSRLLMNMALALAEIAPAVEQFFEPTIPYGYDITRFAQGTQ